MADFRKNTAQRQKDGSVQTNKNISNIPKQKTAAEMVQGEPIIAGTVIESSPAGRLAGSSNEPVIGTNGQTHNSKAVLQQPKQKNLTPGTTVQGSAAFNPGKSTTNPATNIKEGKQTNGIQPIASVSTPSLPGVPGGKTTGLPLISQSTPTPGGVGHNTSIQAQNQILTPGNLDGADLQLYNQLSDAQKRVFQKIGEDAQKLNEDVVKKQLEYLASFQENKNYLTQSNKLAQQGNTLQEQAANMQASQNIARAQATVDSIKQATSYLGSKGQPGKSMAALNAVTRQIDTAQKLFNDIVASENISSQGRALGREQDALNFEHQVQQMTMQFNANVDQAIVEAQNKLGNPDLTGTITDPDEMAKLIAEVMDNLDSDIAGMTNVHVEQMQYLIDQTSKIQAQLQESRQAEMQVNTELSEAYGYYMNENGNPIVGIDGNPIPFAGKPQFSGLDPVTGDFVMVTADGQVVRTPGVGTPKQANRQSDGLGGFFRTRPDGSLEKMGAGGSVYSGSSSVGSLPSGQGLNIDLSTMKAQYPGDAGVANNNPAGITFRYANGGTSSDFAKRLTDAGIPFSEGGKRAEGGTYYKFPTIGDGLKAYDLLHENYLNMTIPAALEKWGTGSLPGITPEMNSMTLGQLKQSNPQAYEQIRMQQIKKESPGVYKALQSIAQNQQPQPNQAIDPVLFGMAKKLIEQGSIEPKDVVALGYDLPSFKNAAKDIYLQGKKAELSELGAELTNESAFVSASPKRKEDTTNALIQVKNIQSDLDDFKRIIGEVGAEPNSYGVKGAQMESLMNSMALTLKEVKNLGVLNGKDYDILLTQIPDPFSLKNNLNPARLRSQLITFENGLNNKINNGLNSMGVRYVTPSNDEMIKTPTAPNATTGAGSNMEYQDIFIINPAQLPNGEEF